MQIRDLPFADPGVPDARSGPRLLLWLGRQQAGGQLKSLGWGLLTLLSVSALPYMVGLAVQAVVDRSAAGLALAGGLMALCGVAIAVADTMLHRTAVTNWITAAARVQQLLARRSAHLGASLTRRVAAGEVVAVATGDIERIGWFVEALSRFLAAAVAVVVICVSLLVYQPDLGLLVACAAPLLALAPLPLLPAATRRADVQRTKAGRATELASDTVAGLRVLRGIGGEELFLDRYRLASQGVRRAAVRSARMWSLISMVQTLLPGLLLIVVVWHGLELARAGRVTVGELVTVYSAVTLLTMPLRNFEEIAMAYSFSRPSARRTARVLALQRDAGTAADEAHNARTPAAPGLPAVPAASAAPGVPGIPGVPDAQSAPALSTVPAAPGTPGAPGLRTVPGGDLLDPATGLLARAGRLTAVVCGDPDAAGRLAERLGGHASSGTDTTETPGTAKKSPSVLLGGVPLDALPLETARAAVLVQDKDPVLLAGTLADLLDVPRSGAVSASRALDAAQCTDVLEALLQGAPDTDDPLQARVTERGRSLSGGQRQRLALARSLVTDPEVLVLDEPTSAVDAHTEARIAESVREVRSGRTTVVLTSSPLLLDRADQVVLVHDGTVLATGSHRSLLRTEPRYRAVVVRDPDDAAGPAPGDAAHGNDATRRSSAPEQTPEESRRNAHENIEEPA